MAGTQVCKPISAAMLYLIVPLLFGCGGLISTPNSPPKPSHPVCDPSKAPQVFLVTIENIPMGNISDFPVAITLDETNFDFTSVAVDGSTIGTWDPQSGKPIPFWIESYDANIRKALIWAKISASSKTSTNVLLTVGNITNCAAQIGNGYSVFPFFSDAKDVSNWTTDHLNISDNTQVTE